MLKSGRVNGLRAAGKAVWNREVYARLRELLARFPKEEAHAIKAIFSLGSLLRVQKKQDEAIAAYEPLIRANLSPELLAHPVSDATFPMTITGKVQKYVLRGGHAAIAKQ